MSWTNVGIGGGGAFGAAAMAPDGTLYVTGDVGGIWKSSDSGVTWTNLGSANSVNDQNLYGIAAGGNTAIIAAGEGGATPKTGLIRSTDAGATWTELSNAGFFTEVISVPINTGRYYAVLQTGFSTAASELYRSADGGATFTQVYQFTSAVTNPRVSKLIVHPTNEDILYAISGAESTPSVNGTKCILKSVNATASPPTFARIGPVDQQSIAFLQVLTMAIDPNVPTTLYCTTVTPRATHKSTDSGATWTQILSHGGVVTACDQGVQLLDAMDGQVTETTAAIEVGPYGGDPSALIEYITITGYTGADHSGAADIKYSFTDNASHDVPAGTEWSNIGDPIVNDTDVSVDGSGAAWTPGALSSITGLQLLQENVPPTYFAVALTSLIIEVYGNSTLVTVVDPDAHSPPVYTSTDRGATWTQRSSSGWTPGWKTMSGYGVFGWAKYGNSKTVYHLGGLKLMWLTSQFVYYSTDGGITYATVCSSAPSGGYYTTTGIDNAVPTALAYAAGTVYAGLYDVGLLRSVDAGASWKPINSIYGWNDTKGGTVFSVCADPSGGTIWMAECGDNAPPTQPRPSGASDQSGPFAMTRSLNQGESWGDVTGLPVRVFTSNPPSPLIMGISVNASTPFGLRTLWCTADGKLYTSVNDGIAWVAVTTSPLPSTGLRVTACSGTYVAVGGENGLYLSRDSGVTWTRMSSGIFPSTTESVATIYVMKWRGVHSILLDGTDLWATYYNAGTTGKGLYKSTVALPNTGTGGTASGDWTLKLADRYSRWVIRDGGGTYYHTSSSATGSGGNASIDSTSSTGLKSSPDGTTWTSQMTGVPWVEFAFPVVSIGTPVIFGQTGGGLWKSS